MTGDITELVEKQHYKDVNYNLLIPYSSLQDNLIYLFKTDINLSYCAFHKVLSDMGIILQNEYNIYQFGIKNYEQELLELLYKFKIINDRLLTISYFSQTEKVYFEFMFEEYGFLIMKFNIKVKL